MARAVSITGGSSIASSSLRPSLINPKPKPLVFLQNHPNSQKPSSGFQLLKVNATGKNPATKPNSIVCNDCDGNGAILCTQCKGTGVNSVDHFNGQFKAGGLCWLCRGKKDILCGNCNGAGFIGGYLSTFDD